MDDFIDEIVGVVCDNVVLNSRHDDFDIDNYDDVRYRIREIMSHALG